MNFITIAAILSTALAIYSCIPYFIAIIKGKTKPHQLSWLVFSIMNGIVFFSQFLAGGRQSVLISFTFFLGSIVIFILSLKYGLRDSSKWDKFLFTFAMITIVIWYFTKSNVLAIYLTIIIDLAATTMMILKIKSMPDSEDVWPWIIGTTAYVFTLLTLVGQPWSILYVRPLYGLLSDLALVVAIYFYQKRSKKKNIESPMEI